MAMTYEEAYDLMNDLHESLQAIDRGSKVVSRDHSLGIGGPPFVLKTTVSREN